MDDAGVEDPAAAGHIAGGAPKCTRLPYLASVSLVPGRPCKEWLRSKDCLGKNARSATADGT